MPGHEGSVRSVSLSSDGSLLAATGQDGTVRLWDLEGQHRSHRVLYRGTEPGQSVAIAGGRLAAAIGATVFVWSLDNLDAAARRFAIHDGDAGELALTPDGRRMFAAGSGKTGYLWDLDEPDGEATELRHTAAIHAAAFHPQGVTLAIAGANSEVALWDTDRPRDPPEVLTADQSEVYDLSFSGDGAALASVGFEPKGRRHVSVWKLGDLAAGSTPIRAKIEMMDLWFTSSSLVLSSDGAQMLVGSSDGTVRRWHPDEQEKNAVSFKSSGGITDIALASRRWLAVGDRAGMIHLYDMSGGSREPVAFAGVRSPTFAIDIATNSQELNTGAADGEVLRHSLAHPRRSPETLSSFASFTSSDGNVRSIATDNRGQWLALGGDDGSIVVLDRADPMAPPRVFEIADGIVAPIVFKPDGSRLFAADGVGILAVDPQTGAHLRRDPQSGRVVGMQTLADGALEAVTSEGDLLRWPPGTNGPPARVELGGPVQNAAFDPRGRWLALTRSNHLVEVFDLSGPGADKIRLDTGFRGSTGSVFGYPVRFSPDGQWFAFSGGDQAIWLWRADEWSRAPIGLGVRGIVEVDLRFSPDSMHLISGGGFDSPPKKWALLEGLQARACARAGRNL
ncbi:MAG: WD40 repeat domain-containing protein, partial [Pseudomonadota bacterium]